MAKAWHFPRWRHLLMQIIMWVILGASVALAAMLDYHLRRAQMIALADPIVEDSLSFKFPAGWKNWTRQTEGDTVQHVATDTNGSVQRSLIVLRQRLPRPIPPAEYILRALPLSGRLSVNDFKPVTIDGWPGQTINWAADRSPMGESDDVQYSYCSAIVLPDDQAVMIRLNKTAPFDAADQHLYQQVLEQVQVATPGPAAGGPIQLAHGITASVPQEMALYPQPDVLRTERMAAAIADDGGWISAEFVPVAVPGGEPSPSLVAGLSAREQLDARDQGLADRWLSAEVVQQGLNHWTISPQDAPNEARAPRRIAHLVTGDGGWGLLVILSAEPPASRTDLEHLWDELSGSIHIPKSAYFVPEQKKGTELAAIATQAPLLDPWNIWERGSLPIGYTQQDPKYPQRYTARRNWNGTATTVLQKWGVTPDSAPVAVMQRYDAETSPNDPLVEMFDEVTTVADSIVTIIHPSRLPVISVPPSPSFVLSRYLPTLLSKVNAPTALWTDRFPGVEAEKFSAPLFVLAHRGADVDGLITIDAEVNGTGSLSRWYFRPDGSLDHADFAGDLHLRPAARGEVEHAIAGDRRLTIPSH